MSSIRTRVGSTRVTRIWVSGALAVLFGVLAGNPSAWAQSPAAPSPTEKKDRARITLSRTLPSLDGKHLKATLVEVNYGPGEFSPSHSHPCAVIGYVVEGELRTQVKGEPEATYKAGESFYEAPNGVHAVSANASQTKPTKFVAFFVCDHETPLSVDVPETKTSEGK